MVLIGQRKRGGKLFSWASKPLRLLSNYNLYQADESPLDYQERQRSETMKLKKAIEILSASANAGMTTFDEKYKAAQRLGIEALKRVQACRKSIFIPPDKLLPGETEED